MKMRVLWNKVTASIFIKAVMTYVCVPGNIGTGFLGNAILFTQKP